MPYGTKGSVRPDYYKSGHSVDIKNYDLSTINGRRNLTRNIAKQYKQRVKNLPRGTKQTVVIDTRGQNMPHNILDELYHEIMKVTDKGIDIRFKVRN